VPHLPACVSKYPTVNSHATNKKPTNDWQKMPTNPKQF